MPQRGWPTARLAYGEEGSAPFAAHSLQLVGQPGLLLQQQFDHIRQAAALATCAPSPSRRWSLNQEQLRERLEMLIGNRRSWPVASSSELARLTKPPSPGVAQLAVPDIADWCAVDIADDTGRLTSDLGNRPHRSRQARIARTLRDRFPDSPTRLARRRTSSARAAGHDCITDAMLVSGVRSPAYLEALRTLQLHSYISAPGRQLRARRDDLRDRGVAADLLITKTCSSHRPAGERAALAVDNARAYGEARAANRAKMSSSPPCRTSCGPPSTPLWGGARSCRQDLARTARALDAIVRNAAPPRRGPSKTSSTCRGFPSARCASTSSSSTSERGRRRRRRRAAAQAKVCAFRPSSRMHGAD